jgi:hypothetical protein
VTREPPNHLGGVRIDATLLELHRIDDGLNDESRDGSFVSFVYGRIGGVPGAFVPHCLFGFELGIASRIIRSHESGH